MERNKKSNMRLVSQIILAMLLIAAFAVEWRFGTTFNFMNLIVITILMISLGIFRKE